MHNFLLVGLNPITKPIIGNMPYNVADQGWITVLPRVMETGDGTG